MMVNLVLRYEKWFDLGNGVEDLHLKLCDEFGKDFPIDLRGAPRLISGYWGSLAGISPNLPINPYMNSQKRVFDTVPNYQPGARICMTLAVR